MGDAGPGTPPPAAFPSTLSLPPPDPSTCTVTVLVTGFGPFKSFHTNPSFLIAEALPEYILPLPTTPTSSLLNTPSASSTPKIRLITHPNPLRVSYSTALSLPPSLISTHNPDYVLHLGMAAGRDFYTLETLARQHGYRIRDVDDQLPETRWQDAQLPEVLVTGWDEEDVLGRWKEEVAETCTFEGKMDEKAVVRLSRDAGRFLCEFILYQSLGVRELEYAAITTTPTPTSPPSSTKATPESTTTAGARVTVAVGVDGIVGENGDQERQVEDRRGKAAFLHVPGAVDEESVARGVRVAVAAIRALVGSWEEGRRRRGVGSMKGVGGLT